MKDSFLAIGGAHPMVRLSDSCTRCEGGGGFKGEPSLGHDQLSIGRGEDCSTRESC